MGKLEIYYIVSLVLLIVFIISMIVCFLLTGGKVDNPTQQQQTAKTLGFVFLGLLIFDILVFAIVFLKNSS